MKPAPFSYVSVQSANQASGHLAEHGDGAKPIAGAQSLGPMLNLRLARPGVLVDVSLLPELREVREAPEGIYLGAATTHAEIEDGEVPDPTGGWLQEAAANIAHRAVRNRGTLGGSLAHADPAADWVIVMTGLSATVLTMSPHGGRKIAMADLVTGPFETALRPDELIVSVLVPRPAASARWGYWKFMRQVGEFAKASATVLADPDNSKSRIAIGALGRQPLVLEPELAEDVLAHRVSASDALRSALPERSATDLALHITALDRALAKVADPGAPRQDRSS